MLFLLILLVLVPAPVYGLSFNRNNIISDEDMTVVTMSLKQIQQFLETKDGVLKNYTDTVNGEVKTAAEIIYEVSQEFRISPMFLIVTLQKEQSLITSPNPSERALNFAMGYGCPDSGGCSEAYRGLFMQLRSAARQVRVNYLDRIDSQGATISGWAPGITKTVDGVDVTPQNKATAALYTYTPHIRGNELFWKIWNAWFAITYPDGALLRVRGEGGIWLIRNGKRHPFYSAPAFFSNYDIRRVVDVSLEELLKYEVGAPITFPNFSLVQAPTGGVYLIVDDVKRPIVSREVFQKIGFNPEEIQPATWDELDAYEQGEPITIESVFPNGILQQSRQTGAIYYVQDNIVHTIHSKEILNNRFRGQRWTTVDQSVIDSYVKGEPVRFRDGTIVTSPNANGVWYIANGKRRGIPSPEIFKALGLRWEYLIRTTDVALFSHPEGEPINFLTD